MDEGSWPDSVSIHWRPGETWLKQSNLASDSKVPILRPYTLTLDLDRAYCGEYIGTVDIYQQDPNLELPWFRLASIQASLVTDTGSNAAVQWAKDRLSRCSNIHPDCKTKRLTDGYKIPQRIPRRLLDISQSPKVRLVEPTERISDYVCLSHSWGGRQAFTTTTSTLASRLVDIPWEQLPLTFQHAIGFTHRLGLQYLWIDSLCILQDNDGDWAEQSSEMANIYSKAYVTIAATRARNGSEGMFSSLNNISKMSWNGIPLVLHKRPESFKSFTEPHPQAFPLLRRAWVAQEMLLSLRVVHFCKASLVFKCIGGSDSSCETGIPGCPGGLKNATFSRLNPNTIFDLRLPHYQSWRDAVKFYCGMSLTFRKDRFPAISGLARRFSENHGFLFVASLFVDDLSAGLLWFADRPANRDTESTAPTWSWASVTHQRLRFPYGINQDVNKYGHHSIKHYSFVSIGSIPLHSFDPYGCLKSAELILSVYLFPFQLEYTTNAKNSQERKTYHARCSLVNNHDKVKKYPDIDLSPNEDRCDSSTGNSEDQWIIDAEFFGIPIVGASFGSDRFISPVCHGLVLRKRGSYQSPFERVGTWELQDQNPGNVLIECKSITERFDAKLQKMIREIVTITQLESQFFFSWINITPYMG